MDWISIIQMTFGGGVGRGLRGCVCGDTAPSY